MGQFSSQAGGVGAFPSHLQPTQGKQLYSGNYIDFLSTGASQWSQQFLPDVYEKEVEIYGNRSISSFLRMVSAEMPSTSDQIIWTEQGRLHARYTDLVSTQTGTIAAAATILFSANQGIAGTPGSSQTQNQGANNSQINFRVGQTVMIQEQTSTSDKRGKAGTSIIKGIVTAVSNTTGASSFTVRVYKAFFIRSCRYILHSISLRI